MRWIYDEDHDSAPAPAPAPGPWARARARELPLVSGLGNAGAGGVNGCRVAEFIPESGSPGPKREIGQNVCVRASVRCWTRSIFPFSFDHNHPCNFSLNLFIFFYFVPTRTFASFRAQPDHPQFGLAFLSCWVGFWGTQKKTYGGGLPYYLTTCDLT